jgi:hypothetical protein
MNAIRYPFKICPLKVKVCSKEAVTKEMMDFPSAFMAKMMMPMSKVRAPTPR